MDSNYGSTDLPRYFITLDKEIIWDYPGDFIHKKLCKNRIIKTYPYNTDISDISTLIEEYIDTDKKILFNTVFKNDYWGLSNILKAADRRIGIRKLPLLKKKIKLH